MKKFFFLFRSVMQRIFLSKGFWGAAAGIAGMNLLGVYQEVSQREIRENPGTRMKPGIPAQGANQFTTHLPLLQRQDGP